MGDKQGHPFRGNQYTATQVAAMDRMHDSAKTNQGHVVAAKHGVRYDPKTGEFKQGVIAMSPESLALRIGRAASEMSTGQTQPVRKAGGAVDAALSSARDAWRASGGAADDKVRAIGEKAIADSAKAKARGASIDERRKILIKAAEDIKAAAHPDSLAGMHRDMGSPAAYEKRVRQLESEGLTRSDAQGAADAEILRADQIASKLGPMTQRPKGVRETLGLDEDSKRLLERNLAAVPNLEQLRRENAIPANAAAIKHSPEDRPVPGKVYNLTGFATGDKSIAKGNTWAESEVKSESAKRVAAPKPGPTKGQKAYARRKERDQIMRDSGLVKVKGARGGTYWE